MIQVRPWFDVAILVYLCFFFYIEALFLRRESRLGWAMLTKCLFLGTLFGYAAAYTILAGDVLWCWCSTGDLWLVTFRVGIAVALTWAIAEMIRGNLRHDERWP